LKTEQRFDTFVAASFGATAMTSSAEQQDNSVKQIVIVGGGFAGLNCAHKLAANPNVRVTLLDKNNDQQFQPLLYQGSRRAPGSQQHRFQFARSRQAPSKCRCSTDRGHLG
jgi:hypothetical protein